MYKIKEAESFVENLVKKNVSYELIKNIFLNNSNFLYSKLDNFNSNLTTGVENTSNSVKYFSDRDNGKVLQNFIDINFQRKNKNNNLSESIFCKSKYNLTNFSNYYLIFPFKKFNFSSGYYIEDLIELLKEDKHTNYYKYFTLSKNKITDKYDLEKFVEYFTKHNIKNIDLKNYDSIDLDIHYYYDKLSIQEANNIIYYFLENYPHILYKYFEIKDNIINSIIDHGGNVSDMTDILDSPANILLNGNFVYIKKEIYDEEKFYIRMLLNSKNIYI